MSSTVEDALARLKADTHASPDSRPNSAKNASTGPAAEAASAALRDYARGNHSSSSKRSSTASKYSRRSFISMISKAGDRSSPSPSRPRQERSRVLLSSFSTLSRPASSHPFASNTPDSASIKEPVAAGGATDRPPAINCAEVTSTTPHSRPEPRRGRSIIADLHRDQKEHDSRSQTPLRFTDLGLDYSKYPLQSQRSSPSLNNVEQAQNEDGHVPPSVQEKELQVSDSVSQLGFVVDAEKGAPWLLNDRIGAPYIIEKGNFLLYADEKEADDDLHNPQPNEEDQLKPKLHHFCAPKQLVSLFGLLFVIVGLITVFILLPVLSYTGHAVYSYPYDTPNPDPTDVYNPALHVNDIKYPLFKNIRHGLIDPDTPKSAMTKSSFLDGDLDLVFSDEFNKPNRTFLPGDDPFWYAQDLWYGVTQDIEWYSPDAVTTSGGVLELRLDQFLSHGLNYQSGMLNSWNQLCFKGGILEVSVSLPGPGGVSGLWPGVWTMGNLGRPGYAASTEGLWPYTYDSCDSGITPNQSMTDGTSWLKGQRLPSCTCTGEDHPTPGTGRGAPEIDVFEARADPNIKLGLITQSYQVAPFDVWYQPDYDHFAIPNYNVTQNNVYCGGPYQQAVSVQTLLNNNWYDANQYQKYGFEYQPGIGSNGHVSWFVGDELSATVSGNALGPNGNIKSRPISEEPQSIILNLGFSTNWDNINYGELLFPTTMRVDYVRIYQKPGESSVTCDPPGYETTQYIKDHIKAYTNPNLTTWDETGYGWPKHKLNTDC